MKIVQIGSNKGNDDLYQYINSHYSNLDFILLVEANSLHITELKECYKNYNPFVENIAIKLPGDDNKELEMFYHINDGPDYAVTSCVKDHIYKHLCYLRSTDPEQEIKSFFVPCVTLQELFDKYNIFDLDWLLIDIEGIDAEVLLTTNWLRYNIKKIEFEYIHLGEHTQRIIDMFTKLGYQQVPALSLFDWAFEK